MASEFQRRKVGGVFRAMDVDGDGRLTESDFQALADRWTAVAGPVDPHRLASVMTGWWPVLQDASDGDGVTLDEVLLVVDGLDGMTDAVAGTADAMFEAIDLDGDGFISRSEYAALIETWSGAPTATDDVFPRLDLDGDGHLTREEFRTHWTEFWAGDNPNAPGSYVFGPPAR
ncbi:Ca2+-binding protein, EF-hand superfamily [Nonomuraea maritima]|uniref:Ca2+-binding protein, EF-hand superfamily n=1 Tax=Nonomuraea maritima TaxID=683260 RepID=A0A1G9KCY4_9ACTN|nr:EF-hand domain-containing protein [Nonomuraea maritima]SDL47557.1 Ca2+-binding protein, EF-hand superfamily [Nonomuraea maritima]